MRKPGYVDESVQVFVERDQCHVDPLTVEATIATNPGAESIEPLSFVGGATIDAYPASAGIHTRGDTLDIQGFVPSNCNELRVVAFRDGDELHVQVEPSDDPLGECGSARRFHAQYLLPPERTYLLVTNGFGFPVVLFDGRVRPS